MKSKDRLPEDDAETAAEKPAKARAGRGGGRRPQKKGRAASGAPAAPGKTGRPKGTKSKPEKPGRVVAIGMDVPKADQKAAESVKPDGYEFGRPTSYHPRFVEIARAMCRLGASDFDLAQEFGVRTETIWNWRCKYSDFFNATTEGKESFDSRVERSLAMRAVGYSYHSEKLFQSEGAVIRAQIVEHVPPETAACRLWLMNRKPNEWRDKQQVELDGTDAFLQLWRAISDGTIGQGSEAA